MKDFQMQTPILLHLLITSPTHKSTSRLRAPLIYPRLAMRNMRYASLIEYGLLNSFIQLFIHIASYCLLLYLVVFKLLYTVR